MKKASALNKESIVFIVERNDVRRLLGMYLAAAGLNARTYPDCDEYLARHEFLRNGISGPGHAISGHGRSYYTTTDRKW
jgi:hypothetical protein